MNELLFRFRNTTWLLGREPIVMGILNVTPDSFSDGGDNFGTDTAVAHGLEMERAGARILDVGGESTRPGSAAVSAEAECDRVVPVIAALCRHVSVPVSVDTSKAEVARAAIEAGAAIVNDVSGLRRDPGMIEVLKESDAGCVVMHMRGTPATMQQFTSYEDLLGEICQYFEDTLTTVSQAGVDPERIMLDPGIGFSKTAEQNLELIAHVARFRALGRPVLLGPSRKSFIGTLLPETAPKQRIWGTAAAVACGMLAGADAVRVHDVDEMRQVATVAAAIRECTRA